MILEITLSQRMAKKFKWKLEKTSNLNEDIFHWYADFAIDKEERERIMFFNSYTNWVSLCFIEQFIKKPFDTFINSIGFQMYHEGILPSISNKYFAEITDVIFTLSNTNKYVSRIQRRKESLPRPLRSFYMNIDFISNYQIKNKYMIPFNEMQAILNDRYGTKDILNNEESRYKNLIKEYIYLYKKPTAFNNVDSETLYRILENEGIERSYAFHLAELLSEFNEPTVEQFCSFVFDYIYDFKQKTKYLSLFNINLKIFDLYQETHLRNFKPTLKSLKNV